MRRVARAHRPDLLNDKQSRQSGYLGGMTDVMQQQRDVDLGAYLESVEGLATFLRSLKGKAFSQDDVDTMRRLQTEERQAKKQFRAHWPDD